MNQQAKQKIAQALVALCKDDGHGVHEGPCACMGITCGRTTCAQWWGLVIENSDMIGDWYNSYERGRENAICANVVIPGRMAGTHPEPEINYAIILKDLGPRRIEVLKFIRSTVDKSLREIIEMKDNLPHTFSFTHWSIAEIFFKTMKAMEADVELFQVEAE